MENDLDGTSLKGKAGMTTITKGQIACRVAVLRDLAKFQERAGANDDAWIASDTADLLEAISAEIAGLTSLLSKASNALEPFATFGIVTGPDGIELDVQSLSRDRVCDWFGPSQFAAARAAHAAIKAATTTEGNPE